MFAQIKNLKLRLFITASISFFALTTLAGEVAEPTPEVFDSAYQPLATRWAPNEKKCGGQYDFNNPIQVMQQELEGCDITHESDGTISQWGIGDSKDPVELKCDHSTATLAAQCFDTVYMNEDNAVDKLNKRVMTDMEHMGPLSADAMYAWSQLVLHRTGWAYNYAQAWLQQGHKDFKSKDFVQFFLGEQLKDLQKLPAWDANKTGWLRRVIGSCNGGFSNRGSDSPETPVAKPVFCSVNQRGNPITLNYDNTATAEMVAKYAQPSTPLPSGGGRAYYPPPRALPVDNFNNSQSSNGGSGGGIGISSAAGYLTAGALVAPFLIKAATPAPLYLPPISITSNQTAVAQPTMAIGASPTTAITATATTPLTGSGGSTITTGTGATVRLGLTKTSTHTIRQPTSTSSSTAAPSADAKTASAPQPTIISRVNKTDSGN
jgi:hypothetical protein